eukprot:Pgem_evm2s5657
MGFCCDLRAKDMTQVFANRVFDYESEVPPFIKFSYHSKTTTDGDGISKEVENYVQCVCNQAYVQGCCEHEKNCFYYYVSKYFCEVKHTTSYRKKIQKCFFRSINKNGVTNNNCGINSLKGKIVYFNSLLSQPVTNTSEKPLRFTGHSFRRTGISTEINHLDLSLVDVANSSKHRDLNSFKRYANTDEQDVISKASTEMTSMIVKKQNHSRVNNRSSDDTVSITTANENSIATITSTSQNSSSDIDKSSAQQHFVFNYWTSNLTLVNDFFYLTVVSA